MEHFYTLTPERILDAVEAALSIPDKGHSVRATGRCMALNSMENRVYEIELEDETRVVAKFYRPGRWSRDSILDEHRFITELTELEIPAIAPLQLSSGSTLNQTAVGENQPSILFAVFPKVRGQILQELDDSRLEQIGRLLARLHNVGARQPAQHRISINPQSYGWESLKILSQSPHVPPQALSRYESVASAILRLIEPLFQNLSAHRIHGDCHLGNVLWFHTGPFFLDFDDMMNGPAVQDVWMIVRGRDEEAKRQRDVLLRGYEQMRPFDRSTLRLIEPLRALRIIHYSAWIARRWDDPSFKNVFPDFINLKYWEEETMDLSEQLARIQEML